MLDCVLLVLAGMGEGTNYVSFDRRQWHTNCFVCNVCDKNVASQGFLIANGDIVCADCGKNM